MFNNKKELKDAASDNDTLWGHQLYGGIKWEQSIFTNITKEICNTFKICKSAFNAHS